MCTLWEATIMVYSNQHLIFYWVLRYGTLDLCNSTDHNDVATAAAQSKQRTEGKKIRRPRIGRQCCSLDSSCLEHSWAGCWFSLGMKRRLQKLNDFKCRFFWQVADYWLAAASRTRLYFKLFLSLPHKARRGAAGHVRAVQGNMQTDIMELAGLKAKIPYLKRLLLFTVKEIIDLSFCIWQEHFFSYPGPKHIQFLSNSCLQTEG